MKLESVKNMNGWEKLAQEAEEMRRRCSIEGKAMVVSVQSTDGSGRIEKVKDLSMIRLSDVAYVDGVCVKHRYFDPDVVNEVKQ